MKEPKKKESEIFFPSKTKTPLSIQRKLAENEGLTIAQLHEKIKKEEALELLYEIRREKGIEVLSKEELKSMIDILSGIEEDLIDMNTSQLLTLIHQGFGKINGLIGAALLKVKKDKNYGLIKKLRKLIDDAEQESNSTNKSNTEETSPQLDNKELDEAIQELQNILNNPQKIEEEISKDNVSKEKTTTNNHKNNEEENIQNNDEKLLLIESNIRNALCTIKLIDQLKIAAVDDRLGLNFLLEVPRQFIWNNLCENTAQTLKTLKESLDNSEGRGHQAISKILEEYEIVTSLELPQGYSEIWKDKKNPKIQSIRKPNLMQRYEAWQIKEQKSRLNLSDAGSGKTLAAVLASQTINSKYTLVFSPKHVIENTWIDTFECAFPNSLEIEKQTWDPKWKTTKNKVLIINYERLKNDPKTHNQIMNFAQTANIDFVILDEIHTAKQRGTLETVINESQDDKEDKIENVSVRRRQLETLLIALRKRNSEMRIYGLTASPALNDLTEPITLLSLVDPGRDVSKMEHIPNIPNGLKVHQFLTMISTRRRESEENKPFKVLRRTIEVDISDKQDDLIQDKSFLPIVQEQHGLDGKIKELAKLLSDGEQTIIWVNHVDGIVEVIRERLQFYGYTTGTFYGSNKSGLKPFIKKENQILIASMHALGTGTDGLQKVCSKAIFFALPWTYELKKQSEARIIRNGQEKDCEIITLEAFYMIDNPKIIANDKKWSWDQHVKNTINSKRVMSDLVVNGEVPNLNSESLIEKAKQGRIEWIERLEKLGGITYKKNFINIPIVFKDEKEKKKVLGKFGNDFSQINAKWNSSRSANLFERIKKDPTEFALYHTYYRENRKTWTTNPLNEVINQLKNIEGLVIGDFGCGEGDLAKEIGDKSKVFSFDMHPVNESIIQCNIAEGVPIAPNTLDLAVFSLSLMTKDWRDMLRTAKKALKITGQIIIWNPKNKIPEDELVNCIKEAGFRIISKDNSIDIEPFINIRAVVDDGSLN